MIFLIATLTDFCLQLWQKKNCGWSQTKICRNYKKLSWDWDRRQTSAISTDKTFAVYFFPDHPLVTSTPAKTISFFDKSYYIDIKWNLISWDRTYLFLLQLYTIFSISIQWILSGRGLIVTFNVIDKRGPWQAMFILNFAHSCFYTFECWVGADDNRWPIFVVTQVLKFHVWRMFCWCSIKLFLVRWMKSYLVCTICICCVCR